MRCDYSGFTVPISPVGPPHVNLLDFISHATAQAFFRELRVVRHMQSADAEEEEEVEEEEELSRDTSVATCCC
jgi:hypothetical protein